MPNYEEECFLDTYEVNGAYGFGFGEKKFDLIFDIRIAHT